jgi:hypothetical protein
MPTTKRQSRGESGSATVEHTGIVLLLAAALAAVAGLWLMPGEAGPGRELGQRVANRIACGPRAPDACRHHPAVEAYGWPVARALRFLAPEPLARPGPDGTPTAPVDFRHCRRPGCAVPVAGPRGTRLTTANRRLTQFTEVEDRRTVGGQLTLTWWMYRPGIGWEAVQRTVDDAALAAASGTRVLLSDSPRLVPLETLDGRNHVDFPPGESPPWQWRVRSAHGARSP